MNITFYGDIHHYQKYLRIGTNPTVQVGDMFFGICDWDEYYSWDEWPANFHFIRGNHDDPEICRDHPNYLGDYGFNHNLNLFYVSGAESIPNDGLPHFDGEELGDYALTAAVDLYKQIRPRYVVSHDCPQSIASMLFNINTYNRTRYKLQWMLDAHKPDIWIFGHHHRKRDIEYQGTRFICLGLGQGIDLNLDIE